MHLALIVGGHERLLLNSNIPEELSALSLEEDDNLATGLTLLAVSGWGCDEFRRYVPHTKPAMEARTATNFSTLIYSRQILLKSFSILLKYQ
jgi:hypothetical protein